MLRSQTSQSLYSHWSIATLTDVLTSSFYQYPTSSNDYKIINQKPSDKEPSQANLRLMIEGCKQRENCIKLLPQCCRVSGWGGNCGRQDVKHGPHEVATPTIDSGTGQLGGEQLFMRNHSHINENIYHSVLHNHFPLLMKLENSKLPNTNPT